MKRILSALLIVLCLTASLSFAEETREYKPWYPFGRGNLLPDPSDVFGRDVSFPEGNIMNNDGAFIGEVIGVTVEDFADYLEACISYGLTIKESYAEMFTATDPNGVLIMVALMGNTMSVTYG